jgi:hypothetical protein
VGSEYPRQERKEEMITVSLSATLTINIETQEDAATVQELGKFLLELHNTDGERTFEDFKSLSGESIELLGSLSQKLSSVPK